MKLFYRGLFNLQKYGFYVCQRIADRFGMRAKVVRTSFIYLTFVTLGFGFAFYLFSGILDPDQGFDIHQNEPLFFDI